MVSQLVKTRRIMKFYGWNFIGSYLFGNQKLEDCILLCYCCYSCSLVRSSWQVYFCELHEYFMLMKPRNCFPTYSVWVRFSLQCSGEENFLGNLTSVWQRELGRFSKRPVYVILKRKEISKRKKEKEQKKGERNNNAQQFQNP